MIIKAPAVLLNDPYVTEIGHALRDCREQSGASVPETADQLLMSKDQINGLENFNLEKFYGERHFAQALIKYAEFLQQPIDPDQITLQGDLTAGLITCYPAPTPEVAQPAQSRWRSHHGYSLAAIAIFGIILWTQFSHPTHERTNTAAPKPTPAVAITQAPEPMPMVEVIETKPAATVAQAIIHPAKNNTPIVLETQSPCWIQLNYADGKSSQKVYPSNTKLEFARGELSGIIIGNLNAATLLVNNEKIVLAKYQKPDSNVARILGQDGSKLLGQ